MNLIYVIFGSSLVFTIVILVINNWKSYAPIAVAGKIKVKCDMNDQYSMLPFDFFFYKWKFICPRNYIAVSVGGESMETFGLHSNEILFVKKILFEKEKHLQKNDIVLIDVEKLPVNKSRKRYKLRLLESIEGDKVIVWTKQDCKIFSKKSNLELSLLYTLP